MLSGKTNSLDPDQTVQKQSDLGLHCLHMLFCQKLWCMKFKDIYCILFSEMFWKSLPV